MILIGLGGNLPSSVGVPTVTLGAALGRLEEAGVKVLARSPWYESAPVPASDQPWFVNGVVQVTTQLGPVELLGLLHRIEADFGRLRHTANASRTLDLDLLAYGEFVRKDQAPVLPHPRMQERAFVLLPLADVAPAWRHPISTLTPAAMLAALPPGQLIRPLELGADTA